MTDANWTSVYSVPNSFASKWLNTIISQWGQLVIVNIA